MTPAANEPSWVVRGGVATPVQLRDGTRQHRGVPGLFGFSVQHQPGRSVEQLAAAGRFFNARISVTTVEQLVAAAGATGYNLRVVRSPGDGFHHTVVVPAPLPDDLAAALSGVFTSAPNPARRREPGETRET